MKKIALWTMIVSSFFLASCSLVHKKQSPEELIKQTQNNFIESLQNDNVFAKKQAKVDGSLTVNLKSPSGNWNGVLVYNWKLSSQKVDLDLNLTWSVNVQWQNYNLDLWTSIITSWNRIYFKLSNFQGQFSDPQLQMLVAMAKMFMNKWFYIDIPKNKYWSYDSKNLSLKLRKIDIKKQFEKYPLFKVNKVIKDKEYEVSLNKENIAYIAYNISKEIDPNFTWTKEQILSWMKEGDIKWVLDIEGDKYFAFSWNILNGLDKVPFVFKFLKDKFYLKTNGIIIDLDKNDDKFKGKINITQSGIVLNTDWELNDKTFKINLKYNQAPINADLWFTYNAEKLDNVDIKIPENAVKLQQAMQMLMWWWMMKWFENQWNSNLKIWR